MVLREEDTLTARTIAALQQLSTEFTLLRTSLPRVAPTQGQPRSRDAPIVRKMAEIIRRDYAKKGERAGAIVSRAGVIEMVVAKATEARASEVQAITVREGTGLTQGEKEAMELAMVEEALLSKEVQATAAKRADKGKGKVSVTTPLLPLPATQENVAHPRSF